MLALRRQRGYNGYMAIIVGARELKNRLGSYLRLVREGATIVVTDRGRPVAELRALGAPDTELDRALRRMAAEGRIILPTSDRLPPREPLPIEGARLAEAIIEDRADRI